MFLRKMIKQIKKKLAIAIISIMYFFRITKNENYNNMYFNRYRIKFGLGLRKKTYILVQVPKKRKQFDTVLFIFNYGNNKAYQFVFSKYGNSFNTMGLYDVE